MGMCVFAQFVELDRSGGGEVDCFVCIQRHLWKNVWKLQFHTVTFYNEILA